MITERCADGAVSRFRSERAGAGAAQAAPARLASSGAIRRACETARCRPRDTRILEIGFHIIDILRCRIWRIRCNDGGPQQPQNNQSGQVQ